MEQNKLQVQGSENDSFIDKAIKSANTLGDAKKVGEIIIQSGFCPEHFVKSNNATGVIITIEAGRQLGIGWLQSLFDIVPISGIPTIKGDLAKTLIYQSGLLESWQESESGEYPNDDYTVTIEAKRKDIPNIFTASYSVKEAKEAGLWVSEEMVKTNPNNKFKPWYKFRKRMMKWRVTGYMADDAFPDVLRGMKIKEAYIDDSMTTKKEAVKTEDVKIATQKAEDKFEKVEAPVEDAVVIEDKEKEKPVKKESTPKKAEVVSDSTDTTSKEKSDEDLGVEFSDSYMERDKQLNSLSLNEIVPEAFNSIPPHWNPEEIVKMSGKQSVKKYKDLILAYEFKGAEGVKEYVKKKLGIDIWEDTRDEDIVEESLITKEDIIEEVNKLTKRVEEKQEDVNAPANRFGIAVSDLIGEKREDSKVLLSEMDKSGITNTEVSRALIMEGLDFEDKYDLCTNGNATTIHSVLNYVYGYRQKES